MSSTIKPATPSLSTDVIFEVYLGEGKDVSCDNKFNPKKGFNRQYISTIYVTPSPNEETFYSADVSKHRHNGPLSLNRVVSYGVFHENNITTLRLSPEVAQTMAISARVSQYWLATGRENSECTAVLKEKKPKFCAGQRYKITISNDPNRHGIYLQALYTEVNVDAGGPAPKPRD